MIPPQIPSKILLLWIHIVSICYYCLRAGIPSRYVTSQLGQLSLASLRGRLIEYQLWLRKGRECHLCRVAGNTVIPYGMWVPVPVWQPCELLYTCYLLTYIGCAHTHPFNGPFSRTTQVSRYQKGKTSLDFTEARDSEWQWHQLGHMQVCISLQTDNHASTPLLSFLQAGCPSCRPTNSIKALKAADWDYYRNFINPWEWHCHGQNCTYWTIIRLLFINIIQTSTLSEPVCQWVQEMCCLSEYDYYIY